MAHLENLESSVAPRILNERKFIFRLKSKFMLMNLNDSAKVIQHLRMCEGNPQILGENEF